MHSGQDQTSVAGPACGYSVYLNPLPPPASGAKEVELVLGAGDWVTTGFGGSAPCRGCSLEGHVLDGSHHRAVPEWYPWPGQLEIPRISGGNLHTLTLGQLPPIAEEGSDYSSEGLGSVGHAWLQVQQGTSLVGGMSRQGWAELTGTCVTVTWMEEQSSMRAHPGCLGAETSDPSCMQLVRGIHVSSWADPRVSWGWN